MLYGLCSWWSKVKWTKKQTFFLYVIFDCCLSPVPPLTQQWDPFFDFIINIMFWNSTKTGKKFQHFMACQGFIDAIKLWAVANLCQELEKIYYFFHEGWCCVITYLSKKNYSSLPLQTFNIFDSICKMRYSNFLFGCMCNTEIILHKISLVCDRHLLFTISTPQQHIPSTNPFHFMYIYISQLPTSLPYIAYSPFL